MSIRKSISNQVFRGWDIARAIDYVAELGYDGIELSPVEIADSIYDISAAERKRIRSAARSAGIEIVGFHSILKSPAEVLHIGHADPAIRAYTADYIKATMDLAGDLDARIIVLGSPQQSRIYPGLTVEQAWDYSVATIEATLDRAEERGAYLCMEPLASFLTDFVTTVAEGLRIVERINHPHFQLMIDVRSASYDEEPIPELIRKSAAHLMHIHANDDNGKGPGTGHADYPGIAAALKGIGYDGYVSVEVFHFEEGPETIATSSLKALQSYFD